MKDELIVIEFKVSVDNDWNVDFWESQWTLQGLQ